MHCAILLSLLVAVTAVSAVEQAANEIRYLFITGDSFTTTGFNPNDASQPSQQRPLGNPAYPGRTYSGGENWVDVVAYNNTNATTATILGYNFAVGGNTVNVTRTQITNPPKPIKDMIDQVSLISTFVKNQGRYPPPAWTSQNSLFIQWFGINDIYWNGISSSRTFAEAQPYLVGDIQDFYNQLDALYKLGGRQFLIVLVPRLVKNSKNALSQNLTKLWNDQIQQQSSGFLATHPDAMVNFFDPASAFNAVLDDPAKYGAPNSTCISNPQGTPCLWLDHIHPGQAIQRSVGYAIFSRIKALGFFP